ncbi:hypothetical protein KKB69_01755 [Patescibacteria group bacterium]|nr:hypothetical protein [Patescibacteria group bacterium]
MIKFEKIKFDPYFWWGVGLVAFLLLFIVILVSNVWFFLALKKDLDSAAIVEDTERAAINEDLFRAASSRIDEKKQAFDRILKEGVKISDPSP